MASREESMRIMESVYAAAFHQAKDWRKERGITGDGHRKPPRNYKMTLWLRPWEYTQLCADASHAGVSVTKHLQEKLTDPRLRPFLPTRENQKLWREEEKSEGKVSSLRKARVKRQQRMIAAKGVAIGDIIPPGKRHAFARARRATGLRA